MGGYRRSQYVVYTKSLWNIRHNAKIPASLLILSSAAALYSSSDMNCSVLAPVSLRTLKLFYIHKNQYKTLKERVKKEKA